MTAVLSERVRLVERWLWAAVLVALPVTSFRYLPFMGPDTQVRPLSLVPAVFLLVALVLRSFSERRLILWNRNFQPLLVFGFIAIITSLVGILLAPPNLNSYTYSSRVIRAWLSFMVGLVFLVTAVCMNRDEQDLKFTIKWLYVGFAVDVFWSLLQIPAHFLYRIHIHFPFFDAFTKTIMMSGLSSNHRISGLALEPSWLAAQLVALYIPWAFAALLKNYDWGIRRFWAWIILSASALLLILSYSRGGILIALGSLLFTLLIAGWDQVRGAWNWFAAPLRSIKTESFRWLETGLRVLVILAILAGLVGGAFLLSRNSYFAKLWNARTTSLVNYLVDIYAGPRLAYVVSGWNIFEQHPLTGVGLGAAGFSMLKDLPDWAHFNISEVAQLLSPDNTSFPNINDLYIRLLAETGILGFWAFISFYALLLGGIIRLLRSKRKELVYLATASFVAWFSILVLGFTQDSLAIPTIWVPLGILIGVMQVST